MVRMKGLEPSHLAAPDPKSGVSTIPPLEQKLERVVFININWHFDKEFMQLFYQLLMQGL